MAESVAAMLKEALQLCWDPRKEKYPRLDLLQEEKKQAPSFGEALNLALAEKKKVLSKYSYPDYAGCVRFIEKAARETGHWLLDVDRIQMKDIRIIMDQAVERNNWSYNARNKYLALLKSLLTIVRKKLQLIKDNPARGIDDLPVLPTEGYKRLTDDERDAVAMHLFENYLDYYEYILFIYQVGTRRTELLQVRIADIDMQNRLLKVRADVAKSNDFRHVPLTDELLDVCARREIWNLPPNFFLFGRDSGRGKEFQPGPLGLHPNTPSKRWRKIVIDGLGIDCKMYSLKHKGADDKILAGISLDVLKTVYGHKSTLMTEVYAKAVKKQYRDEIVAKAPALGKLVKMKQAN